MKKIFIIRKVSGYTLVGVGFSIWTLAWRLLWLSQEKRMFDLDWPPSPVWPFVVFLLFVLIGTIVIVIPFEKRLVKNEVQK